MLERQGIRRASTLALRWLAWLATSVVLVAGGASAQTRVTSLDGELTAGGQSLSLHSELAADDLVELSGNARGSFLIEDNTLVQLCDGAKASFTGVGRLEISQGQLSVAFVARPGEFPLKIDTPTARIEVLGTAVHVMVSPRSGKTTVSSLQGNMRVSGRRSHDTSSVLIDTNEQIAVTRARALGRASHFEPHELAQSGDCLRSEIHRSSAVATSSLMLVTTAREIGADTEDASGFETDLAQIVAADFPKDGLPIEETSTPSALIAELGNAGLDEEVCDPITCNPVFQLPGPEFCGLIPQVGCIPR